MATATPAENSFEPTTVVARVHEWLVGEGYRISRSRLHDHVRMGRVGRDTEGRFTARTVRKYAREYLRRVETGRTEVQEQTDLAEQKLRAEIHLKEVQGERERLKLEVEQGRWVRRDQLEAELVGRAVALEAGFDHAANSRAGELVDLVLGAPEGSATPLLVAALMDLKNDWLGRYVAPIEFEVSVPGEEEAD